MHLTSIKMSMFPMSNLWKVSVAKLWSVKCGIPNKTWTSQCTQPNSWAARVEHLWSLGGHSFVIHRFEILAFNKPGLQSGSSQCLNPSYKLNLNWISHSFLLLNQILLLLRTGTFTHYKNANKQIKSLSCFYDIQSALLNSTTGISTIFTGHIALTPHVKSHS